MTLSDYFVLKSGNQASLVRALGLPQTTVAHWASRSRSVPAEYCVSIEQSTGGAVTRKDLLPNTWSAIWPELATPPSDHGAEVHAAIANARHVFEGERLAEDVLHYLEQVLAAGAPVPAQTGITAGGANASIAEEGLTAAGAEPVVAPDPFRAAARQAVMWQARADLVQAVDAPARPTAAQQADISRHQAAIDRAAAAMVAESAEMVADAERSVAARASTPIVSRLVVEVDTTQLDAALAKAEQLKAVLAELRLS